MTSRHDGRHDVKIFLQNMFKVQANYKRATLLTMARGGAEAEGGGSRAFVQGVGEEVGEGEGLFHYLRVISVFI